MSEKTRPICPLCVAWTCSTCGHKRPTMNAMWVNPYCTRCKGTDGVRRAVRHTNRTTAQDHLESAAKEPVREIVRNDGLVFRWPAPFVDEVPVPGALTHPVREPRHPDGTNADAVLMGRSFRTWNALLTATVAVHQEKETATWSELLLSRVFAALSETEPGKIMENLDRTSELISEWYAELERRLR